MIDFDEVIDSILDGNLDYMKSLAREHEDFPNGRDPFHHEHWLTSAMRSKHDRVGNRCRDRAFSCECCCYTGTNIGLVGRGSSLGGRYSRHVTCWVCIRERCCSHENSECSRRDKTFSGKRRFDV